VNLIAERVKVTDASGHPVDINAALSTPGSTGTEAGDDVAEADAGDADEAEDAEDADQA
jgi:hypothetical protein